MEEGGTSMAAAAAAAANCGGSGNGDAVSAATSSAAASSSSVVSSSIQVLQDWEFCMRLESYNGLFRPLLEKFHRDVKSMLSHVLIVHNETCACHLECASEVNKVWNQKKLAFLELQKLSGLSFDDYLGRVLRLLLRHTATMPSVEPLSESDFWQHLRQPFPGAASNHHHHHHSVKSGGGATAASGGGGTGGGSGSGIDDEELADIQSVIMKDIEMGPAMSATVAAQQGRQRFPPQQPPPLVAAAAANASDLSPLGGGGGRPTSFEESSSSHYDSTDELVRMKRKEKHMAPIDCTGVSVAFGHTWFCKLCSKIHKSKEDCEAYKEIHFPRHVVPNSVTNAEGLPDQLAKFNGRIYTRRGDFLHAFTRLGPLKGVFCDESRIDFDEDRSDVWLLHKENGTRKCLMTGGGESSSSNWVRFVEPANSASEANCLAVSIKNQLYLVTNQDIGGDTPLAYFSKEDPTTEFWTSWTQAWANQKNCSRCSVHGQFETVADYRVHISLWHDMSFQGNPQNRIYYCPDCNAKRIGAKEIVQHCREAHGSLPFSCRECGKRFETYNSLIKHKKRLHSEEKPLKKSCDRCDKVYLDPKALKQHVKQVHEKSDQLHCSQCEMILSSKYALNRHIKEVHHRQQTHVCTHCHKQFTQQSNLKQHLLIHYGVKPFLCRHLSCKSAFTTKQCLQVHYRKVHRYSDEDMPDIKREKTKLDELLFRQSSSSGGVGGGGGGGPASKRAALAKKGTTTSASDSSPLKEEESGGGSSNNSSLDSAPNPSCSYSSYCNRSKQDGGVETPSRHHHHHALQAAAAAAAAATRSNNHSMMLIAQDAAASVGMASVPHHMTSPSSLAMDGDGGIGGGGGHPHQHHHHHFSGNHSDTPPVPGGGGSAAACGYSSLGIKREADL